jgi:hypothetical protein
MPLPPLASDLVSIVVRGQFKPVTVSPRQLFEDKLIGDVECAQSTIEVRIPNETSIFTADWLRCQATADSLDLQTKQEAEQERLRDLAIGVLKTFSDKPISALGINRQVHFPLDDLDNWHAVGDSLVHNEVWTGIMDVVGMRGVIFWAERSDQYAGRIQVQVEPSFEVRPGIFVAYNDHYDLTRVERQPSSREEVAELARAEDLNATTDKVEVAIEVLTNEWQSFSLRTAAALERVWQLARPGK